MSRDSLGRYLPGNPLGGQALINAAKTRCRLGHPFDERNTRVVAYGNGALRNCRTCERERMRRKRSDPDYRVREKRMRYLRQQEAA